MTRVIDERFLTVHPRTALWWSERETCAKCRHVRHRPFNATGGGGGMLCAIAKGGLRDATCISHRERVCGCGPSARLFMPAKKVST